MGKGGNGRGGIRSPFLFFLFLHDVRSARYVPGGNSYPDKKNGSARLHSKAASLGSVFGEASRGSGASTPTAATSTPGGAAALPSLLRPIIATRPPAQQFRHLLYRPTKVLGPTVDAERSAVRARSPHGPRKRPRALNRQTCALSESIIKSMRVNLYTFGFVN